MFKILLTVFVSILSFACSDTTKINSKATFDEYFDMQIDGKQFKAQLAITEEEKARGLMYRESLAEDNTMIFVYNTPQRMSFWMMNTKIPLDLAFFDENGKLLEIKKLYPLDLNSQKSHSDKVMYCIEANSGWFAKNNLKYNSTLDLKKLKDLIKRRGL